MFSSKINLSFLVAVLAGAAQACGPDFPGTIIDSEDGLLAAPFVRFADSLRRIPVAPAEFRSVAPGDRQTPAEQTLAADCADLEATGASAGLIAQYRHLRCTHRALGDSVSFQLPAEFADYHAAACALAHGDTPTAVKLWQLLLAQPAAGRRYKSTWAAYMLGRTATDPADARAHYQLARQLVREGAVDTLGLAAASLGWEAKPWLDHGDYARAAALYLEQFASGDVTAVNSLRFVATRVIAGDNATLNHFAADARLRDVITALVLSQREEEMDPRFVEGVPNIRAGATVCWLTALERAGVTDAGQAARLALAAYRSGEFALTNRWLALAAPDDDLALWLRAKLALRAGDVDLASTHLAALVHRAAQPASSLGGLHVAREGARDPTDGSDEIRAELGVLKLARRDYTEALDLLLQGQYWEDAAYVAERVLTVDELKSYLAAAPPRPTTDSLRHLLARRLFRLDRLVEARAFFPPLLRPSFDRFCTLIETGRNTDQPTAVRAAALMDAARLLKAEGMALRGTELEPDFAIWEGNFEVGLGLASRERLPASLRATADEAARATRERDSATQRFHYRYTAADLAWAAVELMPDQSEVTARALIEAGGWLKARDPKSANRFYQELVRRCGQTRLGATAADKHWFPPERL